MLICNYIAINGLQIQPSKTYAATLDGIFDFNKKITESELYYDGNFYGNSKLSSKDLTLTIMTADRYSKRELIAEQNLNHILKKENIKLQFKLDYTDDTIYECIVNCTSRAYGDGVIVCNLHLSNPNIYTASNIVKLERQFTGGFSFNDGLGFTIPTGGFKFIETLIGNKAQINIGSTLIYPKFKIEGDFSSVTIKNNTTNEILNINYKSSIGDIIEVDCNPSSRKIRLNNSISLIRYKTGRYISLQNGLNDIEIEYTNGNCSVILEYREVI